MATNTSLTFPRETVEFLPLTVLDHTNPVSTFQTALLPFHARPQSADWTNAVTVAGERGLMVNALTPGIYGIWVRVVAAPESIVVGPSDVDGAGYIQIT